MMFDEYVCTGMDVPTARWGPDDVAFWTGTQRYQPWKDVALFFKARADGLDCPQCQGTGVMAGESCDLCHGAGYQPCVEHRCDDPAAEVYGEAGRTYPLCRRHLMEWREAAEA